jgi:hypothetical protein
VNPPPGKTTLLSIPLFGSFLLVCWSRLLSCNDQQCSGSSKGIFGKKTGKISEIGKVFFGTPKCFIRSYFLDHSKPKRLFGVSIHLKHLKI